MMTATKNTVYFRMDVAEEVKVSVDDTNTRISRRSQYGKYDASREEEAQAEMKSLTSKAFADNDKYERGVVTSRVLSLEFVTVNAQDIQPQIEDGILDFLPYVRPAVDPNEDNF